MRFDNLISLMNMKDFVYSLILLSFVSINVLINLKSYFHFQIYREAGKVENNYFSFFLFPFFNIIKWFGAVLPLYPSKNYSESKNYKKVCNLVVAIRSIFLLIVMLFVLLELWYSGSS